MTVRATFLLAVVVVAAGCGGSSSQDSSGTVASSTTSASARGPKDVAVTLKEFTLAAAPASVPAGRVTFGVRNAGQLKHEFVVIKTAKRANALLKGAEADETGNVGEIGDLPPGMRKTLKLSLKAGHYALICNLPGHYKAGQNADFTVR
jgi:uncharacterized cupredoxin-like copper-binding protein